MGLAAPLLTLVLLGAPEQAPKATATLKASTVKPGATVDGTLTLEFADGLHGYQNPPADPFENPVVVRSGHKGFTLKATYPKGVELKAEGKEKPSLVYLGRTEFPFRLTAPKKPGRYVVPLQVSYQQCTETTCYPPSSLTVKLNMTVVK